MKNNTKRFLSLLLVIVMALSFASCADNKADQTDADTAASTQTSADTSTSDSAATDTGAVTQTQETEKIPADGLWADATYRSDKSFGEGAKTIEVEVKADDKSVTFTIKTDKETLGDALLEHKLAEGEQGAYGLYIKKVNGITADYDTDKHYWSLSKSGTALMTGADGEKISGGEHYEIVRTK